MRFAIVKALVFGLVLGLAPSVLACPYCAGQEDGGYASMLIVGAMMALPFLVVATVIPLVRRAGRRAVSFTPVPESGGESR